jgi:hypothetical protein
MAAYCNTKHKCRTGYYFGWETHTTHCLLLNWVTVSLPNVDCDTADVDQDPRSSALSLARASILTA